MPGVRDRNLRSGDLHEELGFLLLRTVALVANVPRQEDVGIDAFVTLIRPDGSRRLIPDLSFGVQLKAASNQMVSYVAPDEVAWLTKLEIPLLIGRVDLTRSRIELFSTQRLHQILLEHIYEEIHLCLDVCSESSASNIRFVNIGPPIHAWSLEDAAQRDFLTLTHSILQPHIESLKRNRLLRGIQYLQLLTWETGQPPVQGASMILSSPASDLRDVLQEMVPHIQRMLAEISMRKRYGSFVSMLAFIQLMRDWGVDPDPGNWALRMTLTQADGPEITDEDVINLRHAAGFNHLNLSNLQLSEESLATIPVVVEQLALIDVPLTERGVSHLLRLTKLTRLNIAGTGITDSVLSRLAVLLNLRWLNVERTEVTQEGIVSLQSSLPDLEIIR